VYAIVVDALLSLIGLLVGLALAFDYRGLAQWFVWVQRNKSPRQTWAPWEIRAVYRISRLTGVPVALLGAIGLVALAVAIF
jgi:hypothetical protein